MKHLLAFQLWHLFEYAELTEVARQNDKLFIDLLNQVQSGNIDNNVENLFKARFIQEFDENYPKDALHMYAENEPAMKRNVVGELYTIEANEKIPDNCEYSLALLNAAQNQEQTNTGGLAKLLKPKTDTKVMLTANIDIQHRLINSKTGIIMHIEFAQGSARKVYVKFSDDQAGSKAMRSSYLD